MDNSAAEDAAALPGSPHLPSVGKRGEAQPRPDQPAAVSTPAPVPRTRETAFDSFGHLKHTRELFWHYWAPVLTMLTLIALQSTELFSGTHTGRVLGALMRLLGNPLSPQTLALVNLALRKTGHVIGYGLLCLSWLLLLRGSYWLRHEYQLCLKGSIQVRRLWWRPAWGALALLSTAAVAMADELHQMSLPGRTGRARDMLLDTCAALLATAIVWHRARRHSAPESQSAKPR